MCDDGDDTKVTPAKNRRHCLICDCPTPPASAQLTKYQSTGVKGLISLLRTRPTVDSEDKSFELQLKGAEYCLQCIQDLEEIYDILGQLEELKAKVFGLIRSSHCPVAAKPSVQQRENLRAEILRKVDRQNEEFMRENQWDDYGSKFTRNGDKCLRLLPVARELLAPDPLSLQMIAIRNVEVEVKIESEMQEWGPEEGSGQAGMFLVNEDKLDKDVRKSARLKPTNSGNILSPPKKKAKSCQIRKKGRSRWRKKQLQNLMKAHEALKHLRLKRLGSQSNSEVSIKAANTNSVTNTKTEVDDGHLHLNTAKSGRVKIIACKVCGERFPNGPGGLKAREAHRNTAHPGLQYGYGTCNICQTGRTYSCLEYHYVENHRTLFKCHADSCQMEFDNFLEYYHHRTTHPELNLPPVKCEECGRIFKHNRNLEYHVARSHPKNPPVTCDSPGCKYVCRTELQLRYHVKTVHDIKPFACEICPRRFTGAYHLRIHILRHEGKQVGSRVCPEPGCGKVFFAASKLRDHREAVHGAATGHGNPHICDICGKSFPIYNYLYIHLRSHETTEEKKARRLKAERAREERRRSGVQILLPKGRPRIRPMKPTRGGETSKRCPTGVTAADLADRDLCMAKVLVQEQLEPVLQPGPKEDRDHGVLSADNHPQQNDKNEQFQAIDTLLKELGTN